MTSPPDVSRLVRALAADLRELGIDLGAGGYTRTTLAMLDHDLRRCVPSALGTTISLTDDQGSPQPVAMTCVTRTVQPDEIASVLRVPLGSLGPGVRATATFYASKPGAFRHVAADLASLVGTSRESLDHNVCPPVAPLEPGITGLHDFSLVNRALGVLLNRGHTLAGARRELQSRAARACTDVVEAARVVLASAHE